LEDAVSIRRESAPRLLFASPECKGGSVGKAGDHERAILEWSAVEVSDGGFCLSLRKKAGAAEAATGVDHSIADDFGEMDPPNGGAERGEFIVIHRGGQRLDKDQMAHGPIL
jgi:hypothetical protein